MNIFSMDSTFYRIISRLGDLLLLNLLFLLCCIPVVTIGASVTALYSVLLKLVRRESGYIVRGFLKAFRENFRQSTILWILFAGIGVIFYYDILFSGIIGGTAGSVLKVVFLFFGMVYLSVLSYVFAVQSRFENRIGRTVKNAFWMAMGYLPFTVSILVIEGLPLFVILWKPGWFWRLLPVMLSVGFAGLGYFCAVVFNFIFKKYMPAAEEEAE